MTAFPKSKMTILTMTTLTTFAFDGCLSLTSVTIGNSVTSIGSDAFNVNSVFFYNEFIPTIISLIENPFALEPLFDGKARLNPPFTKKTYKKAKLFVPKGTIEKYKATKGWKRFKHIIECGADNA